MESIGVTTNALPQLRIFNSGDRKKYKYEGNAESLNEQALD